MTQQPQGTVAAFKDATQEYEQASQAWALASEQLRDAQARLREIERETGYTEAALRVTTPLEGKTADDRAAFFLTICAKDGPLQDAITQGSDAQNEVARWQDAATHARDGLAKAKRVMDFLTAYTQFKAQPGGEPQRRSELRDN